MQWLFLQGTPNEALQDRLSELCNKVGFDKNRDERMPVVCGVCGVWCVVCGVCGVLETMTVQWPLMNMTAIAWENG